MYTMMTLRSLQAHELQGSSIQFTLEHLGLYKIKQLHSKKKYLTF